MQTPVIIPARKEEAMIGRTLQGLDPSTTYPYVVVNGEPDGTADIARSFGVEVLESEEGKMPAIQRALVHIASLDPMSVLSPLHILDADSYPIFPRKWSPAHLSAINGKSVISGLFVSRDKELLDQVALSSLRFANLMQKIILREPVVVGPNFTINIGSTELLEKIIDMPNIWPGEDLAIAETLAGEQIPGVTLDPAAAIRTSLRFMPSLSRVILNGRRQALAEVFSERDARRPDDAITYYDYKATE